MASTLLSIDRLSLSSSLLPLPLPQVCIQTGQAAVTVMVVAEVRLDPITPLAMVVEEVHQEGAV